MSKLLVDRAKKKLPERLASVRGERSQRQFARDLGVFQQNVNRYESGTTPHTDFLIQLAVREGVSLDWLLLGKGRMPGVGALPSRGSGRLGSDRQRGAELPVVPADRRRSVAGARNLLVLIRCYTHSPGSRSCSRCSTT